MAGWARLWQRIKKRKTQEESQGDTYKWDRTGLPGSWAAGPLSVPGFHFRPRYHYSRYRCQAQVARGCGHYLGPRASLFSPGGWRWKEREVERPPLPLRSLLGIYGLHSAALIFSQRVPGACCHPDSLSLGAGWARKRASGLPAGPPALPPPISGGETDPCPTAQPITLTPPQLPFRSLRPLKALV